MVLKSLPSMEHVFSIKVKGSDTGQMFEGTFKYKRPNNRQKSDIDKTMALLNGGIPTLSEETLYLHEILATLRHTLIEAPPWWVQSDSGYELYDLNVIIEISKECAKFEKEWREKVWVEAPTEEVKEEPKAKKKA